MSSGIVEDGLNFENVALATDALLRGNPEALVCGLEENGLIVPIPQSVALWGQAVLTGRALTDVVVAEDRLTVVNAWLRVKEDGVGDGKVRLLGKPSRWMTLHLLDLRKAHGILLGVILPSGEVAGRETDDDADELPPAAPRFCTLTEDETGLMLGCDEAFTQMFGYTPEELIGKSVLDHIHPDDQARAVDGWIAMLSTHRVQQARVRRRRKDGSYVWVDTTLHNYLNQPDRNFVLVENLDVSAEMAAQEALQAQGELLRRLIEAMPDGLLQMDTDRNIVYHNARLLEILQGSGVIASGELEPAGAPGVEISGAAAHPATGPLSTLTAEGTAAFEAALGQVLQEGVDQEVEVDAVLPHGGARRALMSIRVLLRANGEVSGAITSVLDVTDRARAHQELEVRATVDALTGCRNRQSIIATLQRELERDDATNTAVAYIDLDNFKSVNDSLGHSAGDDLLVVTAERLKLISRSEDAVGRLGGDEFLVLLRSLPGPETAMYVAQRIHESLCRRVEISGGSVELRASIGVACADGDTRDASELIERADAAMYRSKEQGLCLPVLAAPPNDPTRAARPRLGSRRRARSATVPSGR